ncbi:VOC family protein [Staphylococcus felis]|uniref:VOC family protein n=1 Tax=Staphylococcus felis TaxID=46127 RepID=UPI000E25DE5D|nr:VOC family protein [Staphylococcus felis]REH80446.1 ring-cleaving dioxygenase [Staphylococcus felis]REI14616.1 ring-cleaving dioxygenase [Staphylococcus felis]
MNNVIGHHHISMYTKDVAQNKAFYMDVLGLKLVKETVNQDDDHMVHLFYGDNESSIGTLLTFFEIPNAGMMRKGTNMIARIGLLVRDEAAIDYFEDRLKKHVNHIEKGTYLGHTALYFDDPETLSFVMIANNGAKLPEGFGNPTNSDIPEAYQILGMGPIEIHIQDDEKTKVYLTEQLGFQPKKDDELDVFTLDKEGLFTDIVVVKKEGPNVRPGRGYVHHHAFATQDDTHLTNLIKLHDGMPGKHSGMIDRKWFKSLYYRQNKIMFEFATVGPGFE